MCQNLIYLVHHLERVHHANSTKKIFEYLLYLYHYEILQGNFNIKIYIFKFIVKYDDYFFKKNLQYSFIFFPLIYSYHKI